MFSFNLNHLSLAVALLAKVPQLKRILGNVFSSFKALIQSHLDMQQILTAFFMLIFLMKYI